MTITTRSKRASSFTSSRTPAAVGPGSYAPEKFISSFKDGPQRPLFSGFATSEKRNLNTNRTTSAITPGPGAYIGDNDQHHATASSNVFATKISRFAPSAPGSTIYRPSTIQDNPGPGSYLQSSSSSSSSSNNNQIYDADSRAVNKFAHLVKPTVPTIPKKEQSYGYLQVGSELQRQPPPATVYSGVGHDTVGPAAYNSHHEIWNDKKNAAASLKSTVQRDVWEANTPLTHVPGPGHYNGSISTSKTKGSKQLQERQSAVFASKVPILASPKPATHFDPDRDLEIRVKEERLTRQQERQKANVAKAKVEAFGSTTRRTELSSQLTTPFSHPTFMQTPGPGMYTDKVHSIAALKIKHRHSSRYHHIREDGVGFSSATERYCLSKPTKPSAPGPGAYKSETPRSLDHTVKSKRAIGRLGAFGSTSERHVWEELERGNTECLVPGPGAYAKPVDTHAGHHPLASNSAAFKSNSMRFGKAAATPHVHTVGEQIVPGVGQYEVPPMLALAGAVSPNSNNSNNQQPLSARAAAPFLSKAERSVFNAKELKDLPGPGAYVTEEENSAMKPVFTRSNDVRVTLGNEERFRVKPTVPENVGPGAYTIPGTVGSKSFNITMKSKTK